MNKTIRRASVFSLLLVLAVMVRVTWVQAVDGRALADDQHNRRNIIAQYANPLGDIVVGGEPVTGSTTTSGGDLRYKRTYTDGGLYSAVTGYSSQVYGATQLEGIYRGVLGGTDPRLKSLPDSLTGKATEPGDVITTIDPAVQRAAFKGLGDKKGAAVAIDPATGRILGMVSTPSYDPSKISGGSNADGSAWSALQADKDQPMLNRALRAAYPPGSTFKLVVAAAALENGLYSSIDEKTDSPNPYPLPGTSRVLANESASAPCENANINVALQYSCNNVFGKMAVDLGQDKVRAAAEKFGFNTDSLDVPVRAAVSSYPKGMDKAQTALSGIGQFDDTATPLQMAMVVAAIANGGELASPHMVSQVTDGNGTALQSYPDGGTTRAVSADTAQKLRKAMVNVVDHGTGSNARISGVEVGGKTGTAQHGENNSGTPYAWFVSYAEDGKGHRIAVAVVVEQSDAARSEVSGNGLAAPIARAMMKAALKTG
ncbi:peptidoglycan D,D-transpeptidase FtsI family protein [Streptomyces sp. H39-S7]|uniref:peptidoglycan D,D-transpeptidase FtsI family protein n=1 Tax=Streptomyces sp. H39-S7 TaxID=3004357 RepID=UPI0022AFA2A8|nr:penicillin-binding transpeptidase domain-containing protein [Streptomyces sp. H39-S7]MCZ4118885.1 penicillin-binding transpeptidase domain-containing protein [Streptomyces sp. H39-S7]